MEDQNGQVAVAGKGGRGLRKLLIIIIVLAVIVFGVIYLLKFQKTVSLSSSSVSATAPVVDANPSAFQAVFLVNGQVYFGKLANQADQFMSLTDVYYLQVNQQIQPADNGAAVPTPDVSLVKLGGELHGPTDQMQINRDQVLLIENLRGDSNVVKAIGDYKTSAAAAAAAPATPAPVQ